MAALIPLTSTTMEGALLELIEELADKQVVPATNPQDVQMITSYQRDGISGLIAVTLSINSGTIEAADGKPIVSATEVFL